MPTCTVRMLQAVVGCLSKGRSPAFWKTTYGEGLPQVLKSDLTSAYTTRSLPTAPPPFVGRFVVISWCPTFAVEISKVFFDIGILANCPISSSTGPNLHWRFDVLIKFVCPLVRKLSVDPVRFQAWIRLPGKGAWPLTICQTQTVTNRLPQYPTSM